MGTVDAVPIHSDIAESHLQLWQTECALLRIGQGQVFDQSRFLIHGELSALPDHIINGCFPLSGISRPADSPLERVADRAAILQQRFAIQRCGGWLGVSRRIRCTRRGVRTTLCRNQDENYRNQQQENDPSFHFITFLSIKCAVRISPSGSAIIRFLRISLGQVIDQHLFLFRVELSALSDHILNDRFPMSSISGLADRPFQGVAGSAAILQEGFTIQRRGGRFRRAGRCRCSSRLSIGRFRRAGRCDR
jgi:hypothetical protein